MKQSDLCIHTFFPSISQIVKTKQNPIKHTKQQEQQKQTIVNDYSSGIEFEIREREAS